MKRLVAFFAAALACFVLTVLVVVFDIQILLALTGLQNPALNAVMLGLTQIMTIYIGVPIILVLAYFLPKRREMFWDLLAATAITGFAVLFLKTATARPRPDEPLTTPLVDEFLGSMPSDHAAMSLAALGTMGRFYRKWRLPLYLLAFVICLSRIYLGVHYPTDVLAGAALGAFVSWAVPRYGLGKRLRGTIVRKKR